MLIHNCNFDTVMNLNISISVFQKSWAPPEIGSHTEYKNYCSNSSSIIVLQAMMGGTVFSPSFRKEQLIPSTARSVVKGKHPTPNAYYRCSWTLFKKLAKYNTLFVTLQCQLEIGIN